jgi:hypothetical protein
MRTRKTLVQKIQYQLQLRAVKTQQNFTLILIGFTLTLAGIGLVMGGEYIVSDTFHRELVALAGVIIIGTGCLLAAVGYLSMSLLRIFYVITKDDEQENRKK